MSRRWTRTHEASLAGASCTAIGQRLGSARRARPWQRQPTSQPFHAGIDRRCCAPQAPSPRLRSFPYHDREPESSVCGPSLTPVSIVILGQSSIYHCSAQHASQNQARETSGPLTRISVLRLLLILTLHCPLMNIEPRELLMLFASYVYLNSLRQLVGVRDGEKVYAHGQPANVPSAKFQPRKSLSQAIFMPNNQDTTHDIKKPI